MIEQILFQSSTAHEDQLIFKMNGAFLPSTFALGGDRPRIVFDFPGVIPSKKVQNAIQADGTFIKRIRTGIHKGENPKTRIVIDLQPGMKIDFDQNFSDKTNTLIISLFAEGMPRPSAAAMEKKPEAAKEEAAPAAETAMEPQAPAEEAVPVQPAAAASETPQAQPTQVMVQPAEKAQMEETAPPAEAPPTPARPETLARPEMQESTVIQPLSEIGGKEEAAKTEAEPTLYSVEFDDTSHRGEIVSFKLNGFHPPIVFGIEEEVPRIVCFFKDTSAGDDLGEFIATDGKYIKSIKIGKYRNPDNVRVVLDLVPGKNYDLQQIFFKEDKLFMVILNSTGDKTAN